MTKNDTFLYNDADQFYRLGSKSSPGGGPGQIPQTGLVIPVLGNVTLRVLAVSPAAGWRQPGLLRVNTESPVIPGTLVVSLNGRNLDLHVVCTTPMRRFTCANSLKLLTLCASHES